MILLLTPKTVSEMFQQCDIIQSISEDIISRSKTVSEMFQQCDNIQSISEDIVSRSKTVSEMFQQCDIIQSISEDIISRSKTVSEVFQQCDNIQSISEDIISTSKACFPTQCFNLFASVCVIVTFVSSSIYCILDQNFHSFVSFLSNTLYSIASY